MTHHRSPLWPAVLGLLLMGAASSVHKPDDLVREGNAAFAREDYAAAVDWYTRAEDRTLDPGIVAFNKGTALYHLGRYREAELHFRRCQEDAQGSRLARLLYNLGNSLLQQAGTGHASKLRDAINQYEKCLEQPNLEEDLVDDVRHNLELARLLWLKARANKNGPDESEREENEDKPLRDSRTDDPKQAGEDSGSATPDPRGNPEQVAEPPADPRSGAARGEQSPPPGKGDLPTIPDQDELIPLAPEDAAEYLKQAATRIGQERQKHLEQLAPRLPANVKDW